MSKLEQQRSLVKNQNRAYTESLIADRMKENQSIVAKLETYSSEKDERDRLARLEKLNAMDAHQRREYILRTTYCKNETDCQKMDCDDNHTNHTNHANHTENVCEEENDNVNDAMIWTYTINGKHSFQFNIEELYRSGRITINTRKIESVLLPVNIDGFEYNYYLSPDTDAQWDYTILWYIVENFQLEESSDVVYRRIVKIKATTLEKLSSQLGIAYAKFDDEQLREYIEADCTDAQIVTKLIEKTIQQYF